MKKLCLTEKFYSGCAGGCERMNPGLLACFSTAPKYLLRAQCPSGVRIRFRTDARKLELRFTFGDAVRNVFTTDIFVNKRCMTLEGEGPHAVELPPGEKTVTIHLPHLVLIRKTELFLDDNASAEPLKPEGKTILFCGDSIMQGMVTSSPSLAIAPKTAAGLGMDFINTSVGGARMNPEHVRETALLPGDLMIVALGVNDAILKTDFGLFRENTGKSLQELVRFSGEKHLILPIPNTMPSTPNLEKYRDIIRDVVCRYPEIHVLDGYDFFPAEKENYFDGTHPDDRGAEIYANHLIKTIGGKK